MARFRVQKRNSRAPAVSGVSWRPVAAGLIFTICLTLVVSALLAIAIAWTTLTEMALSGPTYYIALVVVALGGAYGARRASSLGWVHGGLVGILYALVAGVLGGLIFPGGILAAEIGMRIAIAFLAGAIGGMIGVNL